MFVLHPSGYCSFDSESGRDNLIRGTKCPCCNRVAGHSYLCPYFKFKPGATASRGKLYDCCAVLWAKSDVTNFITFTLPSLTDGTYQRDPDCPETGDLVIAVKFSRVLEAWKIRNKRRGKNISYTWCAEAQMKRQAKFGGIGDIHYHLVANVSIKNRLDKMEDIDELQWLQAQWCNAIGVSSANCVDVAGLPEGVNSVPAYMAKYMGKGEGRAIIGRKFGATRDLTKYQPLRFKTLPELPEVTRREFSTLTGYEGTVIYFDTRTTLETYGALMSQESKFQGNDKFDARFTYAAITDRAIRRTVGLSYPT